MFRYDDGKCLINTCMQQFSIRTLTLENPSSTPINCGSFAVVACIRDMLRSRSGSDLKTSRTVCCSSGFAIKSSIASSLRLCVFGGVVIVKHKGSERLMTVN